MQPAPPGTFAQKVQEYLRLKDEAKKRVPPVKKDEKDPARLEAYQRELQFEIRVARTDAVRGAIFDAETERAVVDAIAREMDQKTRQAILQGNPKTEGKQSAKDPKQEVPVTLKVDVNTPYAPDAPQSAMPPNLLKAFPQLPEGLQYHFVGPHLILEDADARLIVDYVPNAVREPLRADANAPRPSPAPPGPAKPIEPLPTGHGIAMPLAKDSVRFVVIGDTGSAADEQYELAGLMTEAYARFPFTFVLMMGDNIYGTHTPQDFVNKFEAPYEPLLKSGVKFYAALGNHDDRGEINYKDFNMGGKRYYTFKPQQGVRIFAFDTNYLDKEQLAWAEKELAGSASEWKICFFHHPLYSSGLKHGGMESARQVLEPLFVQHGVDVVFAGHEHFYERLKPQRGIYHFISGAGGKLREGNIRKGSPLTAKGYDTDLSFMLVEIVGDQMYFQVFARGGRTVDAGIVRRKFEPAAASLPAP